MLASRTGISFRKNVNEFEADAFFFPMNKPDKHWAKINGFLNNF